MSNDIRNLANQQSQGSQRNVDKDGIFLTENYGGLNTESSPMNMPLTDSPALMNVEVQPSGKLAKRKGSRYMNSGIGVIDQIIPVKLSNGTVIFVLLGNVSISVQPDAYDNVTALYSAVNIFPNQSYNNTSYVTTTYDGVTYIHFVREGSPPVVLEIAEVPATNVGNAVTLTSKFDVFNRDTTKVSNCKYLLNDAWLDFTSINASTGASVLTTSPDNGSGLFVHFHWHWVAQTEWRDKAHLQFDFSRTYDSQVSCSIELPSRFKQAVLNQLGAATNLKYAQNNGTTRIAAVSGTSVAFLSNQLSVGTAVAPTLLPAAISPQLDATNVARAWWVNSGQRPALGAFSTVSGNVVSTNTSDYYAAFPTHVLFGGNWYTDAGYLVPLAPGFNVLFNDFHIPFDAGDGSENTNLTADTDRVDVSIISSTTWQTTGYALRLDYQAGAGYTDPTTATDVKGQWLNGYAGANVGLVGDSLKVTKHNVPTGAGAGAVAGANKLGYTKIDGRYTTEYNLIQYMNYKTGVYASVVGTYQDRLCYAGFAGNPGTLLFSNTGTADETYFRQKRPHMNFDTNYTDPELATSPLTIDLNLRGGERIVAMRQWYDDLFVGTNQSIYRIHGGDNVAITPSNFFVSKVANVGTITNGMELTVDGIVFLSDSGVYRVILDQNTTAYSVTNIGIKIRNEIKKCMGGERFFKSVGRISYDNTNNVLYVLVGDEYNSSKPRRCFVYYSDRDAWSEWSMYNGFMNAQGAACIDGRVFMGLAGSASTFATICEFNMDGYYTDANATVTLLDDADVGYDLDVCSATFTRSDYVAGSNPVLNFGSALKVPPIKDTINISVFNTVNGVQGVDYWRHKGNALVVEGTTFWKGAEVLYVSTFQEEDNYRVLNVWSTTDEDWIGLDDLTYTSDMFVRATAGSEYTDESVVVSLSYPTWWVSPAFSRNDIKDLKRMHHFYGIFENSSLAGNNIYTAPSWDTLNSFNVNIIQNGTSSGEYIPDQQGSDTIRDLNPAAPAWLDYFRVSLPIKGSFISFQAAVHSFDRGQWEMVGYQIETGSEGRSSRGAYNE